MPFLPVLGQIFSCIFLALVAWKITRSHPVMCVYRCLQSAAKAYFRDAMVKMFTHPARVMDNATYETEFQCWYSKMIQGRCNGLKSQANGRKKKLSELCTDVKQNWIQIWKSFLPAELKYFKNTFPAKDLDGDADTATHYMQTMQTMKELDKKELLCLTLFTIDDDCGGHKHVRMG